MDIKRQSPGCLPPVAHLLISHFTVCPSSSCWILVVDSQFAITCSGDPYRPCAFASNKIRKGFASNKERKQITSTPWTLPRNTVNNNLSLSLSLSISLSLSLSRARARTLSVSAPDHSRNRFYGATLAGALPAARQVRPPFSAGSSTVWLLPETSLSNVRGSSCIEAPAAKAGRNAGRKINFSRYKNLNLSHYNERPSRGQVNNHEPLPFILNVKLPLES
jgi:hypothetical protein